MNITEENMNRHLGVLALALLMVPGVALAHGGHQHVAGTVQSVSAAKIAVKTANGTITVPLSPATKYYHGTETKDPAHADEVKPGTRVVIHEAADGAAAEVHIPRRTSGS
jgi:hypothetical protein